MRRLYNSDSENMGGFYEQIAPGAFRDVMGDDVRAYLNHDENRLLGRVSSGTLAISSDERGLYYEVKMPNTTYANDLIELMKRGDINQSSFAFLIGDDYWEERNGQNLPNHHKDITIAWMFQPRKHNRLIRIRHREVSTARFGNRTKS